MSHFAVAVFTKEGQFVEDLLAPFHEFECTGEIDEYVQSVDILQETKEEYKKHTFTKLKDANGVLHDPYSNEFYREPTEEEQKTVGSGSGFGKGISWSSKDWKDGRGYRAKVRFIPEGFKEVEVKATDVMSFRDFAEYYHDTPFILDHEKPDLLDEHKWGWGKVNNKGEVVELVRRTNPNAKWDWYQIGGRWSGSLKLKQGDTSGQIMVDSAKIKDIDFSIDSEKYAEAIRFWELIVECQTPENEHEERVVKYNFYNSMYYSDRYDSKEQYAQLTAEFGTYAAITPDGVWHSKGDMGWFGCGSESDEEAKRWNQSFKEMFIDSADPEWTLTVVDCHI